MKKGNISYEQQFLNKIKYIFSKNNYCKDSIFSLNIYIISITLMDMEPLVFVFSIFKYTLYTTLKAQIGTISHLYILILRLNLSGSLKNIIDETIIKIFSADCGFLNVRIFFQFMLIYI